MQPSDQLVAAADLIRDLAAHACKGPWFAPGPDDTEERIWAHNGHGPRGYTVVESCDYDDGRWIAALSPALAPMIQVWLRRASEHWAVATKAAGEGVRGGSGALITSDQLVGETDHAALALARALLGQDTPKKETNGG